MGSGMTANVRPAVIGNWKMNGLLVARGELVALAGTLEGADRDVDVMICPPATLIAAFAADARGLAIAIGAQDCHPKENGAHTGDISAPMLKDAGASAVIVGHSERRTDHGESDALVNAKAEAALAAGLQTIICVGETEDQRDSGQTLDVLSRQLAGSVPDGANAGSVIVAYEPVWAIGTGRTPTEDQIAEAHSHMRAILSARFAEQGQRMRLLYGGSVKAANAAAIFAIDHVNGGLVGGASLKAADFAPIVRAARP